MEKYIFFHFSEVLGNNFSLIDTTLFIIEHYLEEKELKLVFMDGLHDLFPCW